MRNTRDRCLGVQRKPTPAAFGPQDFRECCLVNEKHERPLLRGSKKYGKMPGCAAIGCNNRSEKGYTMKCFPRDPKLRTIWKERVGRAAWEPSNNSFLCHMHFDSKQWMVTHSGKIKLRKDAMPSIFNVTTTRKSHKKRSLHDRGFESDGDYLIEYLEDDGEYKTLPVDNNTERSDEPDGNDSATATNIQPIGGLKREAKVKVENRPEYQIPLEFKNLDKENIVIVSDANNRQIGIGIISVKQNLFNSRSTVCKTEIDRDYDEIEAKMKQICDGEGIFEDEGADRIEKSREENADVDPIATGRNDSMHCDKEIPRNVEIIFGTESGNESTSTDDQESQEKQDPEPVSSNVGIKAVQRTEDNDESKKAASNKNTVLITDKKDVGSKEVHAMPDMRAAVKRKLKVKEEIIKSVGRSITAGSELRPDSQDSSQKRSDDDQPEAKKSKFTIMVPEKAKEIIKEHGPIGKDVKLSSNDIPEDKMSLAKNQRENLLMDSAIATHADMIDKFRASEEQQFSGFESVDDAEYSVAEVASPKSAKSSRKPALKTRQCPSEIQTLFNRNKAFIHTEESDRKNTFVRNETSTSMARGNESPTSRRNLNNEVRMPEEDDDKSPIRIKGLNMSNIIVQRELLEKLNAQREVIDKLTNQLIAYKNLEVEVVKLNLAMQVKNKELEILHKMQKVSRPNKTLNKDQDRSSMELKQKTIRDLTTRVNQLDETNKRLMRTIAIESQEKRKLETRLRQSNERIKELNWKLGKASKYLEKAEKNTNTYKKKMMSMQTIFRRQKVLEEKCSNFKQLMVDNLTRKFSEKALLAALDIKNSCGKECYQKLLSYQFPLPSLKTLRRRFQRGDQQQDWGEDEEDDYEVGERINFGTQEEAPAKKVIIGQGEVIETEVRGTVQDLFEDNDAGDVNTNELKEHFNL